MDQPELIVRARRGDGVAFGALVEGDLAAMVRLAAVVSGNPADAEDIVQEALTKVLQSLHRFDENRPFQPWFATIVANQARNWKRSCGRRFRLVERIALQANLPIRGVDEIVIEADEGSRVVAALQILDPVDREVLALRFLAGLTERESAEALGVAVGTVKSRTSRALTRLRMQLEPERETNAERRRVGLAPPVQPRQPQGVGGTSTAHEKPVEPAGTVEPLEPLEHLEPAEHREMSRKWTAQ
jgi:RNA polymerase sigma-70 factor, ECF subfamily